MSQPVVIDLETQFTFREKGSDPRNLKISVAGLYDYSTNNYYSFTETELPQLFPYLENASAIIGFNIWDFDLEVLAPYYVGNLRRFKIVDLLTHVHKTLGYRVSLDNLAKETLGIGKTSHGLMAIEYFRSGELDKLRDYCLSDVKITKELYDFGVKQRKIYYTSTSGRQTLTVDWEIKGESEAVPLTLPW